MIRKCPVCTLKFCDRLDQDADGYPPIGVEGLWARKSPTGAVFVDSIPFYVYHLAPADEISVTMIDGSYWFDSIVRSAGHSVFRIAAHRKDDMEEIKKELAVLGFASETDMKFFIIAPDAGENMDIKPLLSYLVEGRESDRFDFEEGVLRHLTD